MGVYLMTLSAITKTSAIIIVVIAIIAVAGGVLLLTQQPAQPPATTTTTTTTATTATTTITTTTTTTTTTTATTPVSSTITIGNVTIRVPEEFAKFVEKVKTGEVKVTIYFGHALNPEERDSFIKVINAFKQEYPGIDVVEKRYGGMGELQSAVIAAATLPSAQRESLVGQAPDVFNWAHDWIGWFADSGYIVSLEDYIGYDAVDDISQNILPSAMSSVTYLGKTYGLPYAGEALALYVNTMLVPNPPTTFNELKTLMEQFYKPSEGKYGIAGQITGQYHTNPWVTAFGGFYYDDVRKELGYLKPETAEGLKFFVAYILRYMDVSDLGNDYQRRLFGEGKTPFYISGPWDVKYAVETLGVNNFTVVPLPSIDNKIPKPWSGFRIIYISVMATAGGKERTYASILFALYIALDDNAIQTLVNELGYIPVKPSVADYVRANINANPLYKIVLGFYEQLGKSVPMPKDANMQKVWGADTYLQAIWKAYSDAISSGRSPDDAVQAAIAQVDKALSDAYNDVSAKIQK
ncbi:MAG: extracellular solute-binding protein [Desulfurococcus sp.]|uniref:extracellular solute-binding protein n=3 Tax=Desulfurococcus sp. TaxID=51678 RepID=UPI0031686806